MRFNLLVLSLIVMMLLMVDIEGKKKGKGKKGKKADKDAKAAGSGERVAEEENDIYNDKGKIAVEDGMELIEGDVLIPKSAKLTGVGHTQRKWTNNTLFYAYSTPQIESDIDAKVQEALKDIKECVPCLNFKKRTTESNYVDIIYGGGCFSALGQATGKQPLSIPPNGCQGHAVIVHEFLHALGVHHQHVRPDRDEHITVHFDAVNQDEDAKQANFGKADSNLFTVMGLPYDYSSVMHYGKYGFAFRDANNVPTGPTITPTDPKAFIGQRRGLSAGDIAFLNRYYQCGDAYKQMPQCTTATKAANCVNTANDASCTQWKNDGDCTSHRWHSQMGRECPAICEFCNKHITYAPVPETTTAAPADNSNCVDNPDDAAFCPDWVAAGECLPDHVFYGYTSVHCCASCKAAGH